MSRYSRLYCKEPIPGRFVPYLVQSEHNCCNTEGYVTEGVFHPSCQRRTMGQQRGTTETSVATIFFPFCNWALLASQQCTFSWKQREQENELKVLWIALDCFTALTGKHGTAAGRRLQGGVPPAEAAQATRGHCKPAGSAVLRETLHHAPQPPRRRRVVRAPHGVRAEE